MINQPARSQYLILSLCQFVLYFYPLPPQQPHSITPSNRIVLVPAITTTYFSTITPPACSHCLILTLCTFVTYSHPFSLRRYIDSLPYGFCSSSHTIPLYICDVLILGTTPTLYHKLPRWLAFIVSYYPSVNLNRIPTQPATTATLSYYPSLNSYRIEAHYHHDVVATITPADCSHRLIPTVCHFLQY